MAESPRRSVRAFASEEEQGRYGHCFACGPENPNGLSLEFYEGEGGSVSAVFQPKDVHQGWPRILHGGIVATLLDEAAAYVAYVRDQHAATARLNMRFATPAPLDEPLRVEARLVRATRRLLEVEAEVATLTGAPIATAQATLMLLTDHQKREYGLTTGQDIPR